MSYKTLWPAPPPPSSKKTQEQKLEKQPYLPVQIKNFEIFSAWDSRTKVGKDPLSSPENIGLWNLVTFELRNKSYKSIPIQPYPPPPHPPQKLWFFEILLVEDWGTKSTSSPSPPKIWDFEILSALDSGTKVGKLPPPSVTYYSPVTHCGDYAEHL